MTTESTANVFITGVSSGLGLGLAQAFLEDGAQVYGLSRRRPEELLKYENFHFLELDLSRLDEISGVLTPFLGAVDRLELVILNAGILGEIKDLADVEMDVLKQVMDVNLWANKLVLDNLLSSVKTIQQIIAVSSGASVSGNRGWNGYSLSKAALNMLIQLYASENEGIHFTSLAPGLVDTSMQDHISSLPETADETFPIVKRLRAARGTSVMPQPTEAARDIINCFPKLLKLPSGSYADVRKID